MAEKVRAFVALEIAEPMRARIVELTGRLRPRLAGIRWAPAEQLHLTLRFLGDSAPEALARLEKDLGEAARACPACDAPVRGLGMFPEHGGPRVLWLAMELPPAVLALQAACEHAAVAAGFPPERRAFRPHLTLGRWRGPARRPALPEADLGATRLDSLILFKSELRPQGAIHTPLARLTLGS
jgi:2'-5' RNA ligase